MTEHVHRKQRPQAQAIAEKVRAKPGVPVITYKNARPTAYRLRDGLLAQGVLAKVERRVDARTLAKPAWPKGKGEFRVVASIEAPEPVPEPPPKPTTSIDRSLYKR